jgi:hypothetical protein
MKIIFALVLFFAPFTASADEFEDYCVAKIKSDLLQGDDPNLNVFVLFPEEMRTIFSVSVVADETYYSSWIACYKDRSRDLEVLEVPF